MSLYCDPKNKTPQASYLARVVQQTNRDIGLSPVFNVNTSIYSCVEDFTTPTFTVSGSCDFTTGQTINSEGVYIMDDDLTEINLIYNFTGSTDYTGYTGFWCYEVTGQIPFGNLLNACTKYSNITGGSVTINVLDGLPTIDNEYIVRNSNKFKPKCPTRSYNYRIREGETKSGVLTVGNVPGYIDTSFFPDELIPLPEIGEQQNFDLFRPKTLKNGETYFVTTVKPPKPNLEFIGFNVFNDISFTSEVITPNEGDNSVLLRSAPVAGKVLLSVNGITVSENDYTVDTDTNLLTFNSVTLESNDIVQAYYNTTSLSDEGGSLTALQNRVKLEMYTISNIVSGLTATTYVNTVNWNTDNLRYEFFLQEKIDPNILPIITVNGVLLNYNVDVFKSSKVANKLIFKEGTTFEIGDIISVYYYFSGFNNVGDLGTLNTDTPQFKWSALRNVLKTGGFFGDSTGLFTVEITDRDDVDFETILYTGTSVYNNGENGYTLNVGPITTTSYSSYIYRVKFSKSYITNNVFNVYVTDSYSDVGSFKLNWNQILNSNF